MLVEASEKLNEVPLRDSNVMAGPVQTQTVIVLMLLSWSLPFMHVSLNRIQGKSAMQWHDRFIGE